MSMEEPGSSQTRIARSVAVVGLGTLTSRITGLARDVVLAWILGASFQADAFFAAFRIPNFLRRVFAEGSLSTAFVPVFTELYLKEKLKTAFDLGSAVLSWLLPCLVLVSAAGVIFAPQIVAVMTPGWSNDPEKFSLTVVLTRWMFPYILLISCAALAMGMLNAQGHFASPAFAPVFLNLSLIFAALVSHKWVEVPVVGIAWGVLLGGIAQVLVQVPFLWKRGFRPRLGLLQQNPHLKKVRRLLGPSLLSSTVYQVNMIVITVLASLLPSGSLSYLFYADRLMEFPLGVFAISVGTVALPALSREAAKADRLGLERTLGFAFRNVSLIMVPATVGLIVLREPLMEVIFQRGRFDPVATKMSAQALMCYAVGLWFIGQLRVIGPLFYALQDTKTPTIAAIASLIVNLFLALALMRPLYHSGLALALSLSAAFQLGLLMHRIGDKLHRIPWEELFKDFHKVLIASALMGLVCGAASSLVPWGAGSPFVIRTAGLAGLVLGGALFYTLTLAILKVEDLKRLLKAFGKARGD